MLVRCPQQMTAYKQVGPVCFDAAMYMMFTAYKKGYAPMPGWKKKDKNEYFYGHAKSVGCTVSDWASFEGMKTGMEALKAALSEGPFVACWQAPEALSLDAPAVGHAVCVVAVETEKKTVYYMDPNRPIPDSEMQYQEFVLATDAVIRIAA
jgi:hypothetical protein